ncbi:hypothetical protein BHU72_01880 [Desulfuribacillus stibiiarsenatis]|uniref:ABC-three component systems C-terminal domain-containing protein n=1 Tax=Desulfuribacillus stibiiarsenatis TaxID=1390249 RepID=A0A1E5L5Z0_9FIRM|nr:ABC-three component system protein [Desulfuribacillus stibiiarsenatis]OEH85572.1 hypothetical protein BHU72_01880 [Desulfuribacillus stibiiarsenatis]
MIDKFYDQVVVKTLYKGSHYGSGVLLQTENKNCSYLITAWHCLNNDLTPDLDSLQLFQQTNGEMNQLNIIPDGTLIIEKNDIAIIKMKAISDLPIYRMATVSIGEQVSIVGFPRAMDNNYSRIKRFPLGAKVISLPDENTVTLSTEQTLETLTLSAKDVVSSISGSGIFKVNEEEIFLCGIIIELSSPDGAFDAVCGISRECIQKNLIDIGWDPICDIKICSFDLFKDKVIEIFEEPMNRICSLQMPNIRNSVKPNDIIMHCGTKLVWPYSDKNLYSKDIWESWLLYLIFRSLENQDNLKDGKFYMVDNERGKRKVKLIYVTNKTTLSEFLKDYLGNAYVDASKDAFVIIKTKKEPQIKKLNHSLIESVVRDISNPVSVKEEMRIDDVRSCIRKLSLIHIGRIIEGLNIILENYVAEGNDDIDLERQLGQRIGEMLNEF